MSQPDATCSNPARRQTLNATGGLMLGLVLAVLGGCTSPPPASPAAPAPRFSAAQVAALRQLGFAEVTEGWELNLAGKVLFAFNDERLGQDGLQTTAHIAETLRRERLTRLRIEGHADNVGDVAYNQRLSLRRAETVAREFLSRGMATDQVEIRGMGATMPIADNATETGRSQNRRVVILVRGD